MDDIFFETFKFLEYVALLKCSSVCRKWLEMSRSDILWNLLIDSDFDKIKHMVEGHPIQRYIKCFQILNVMITLGVSDPNTDDLFYNIKRWHKITPAIFSGICHLTNLTKLNLINKQLQYLPFLSPSIGNLTKLDYLNLEGTNIVSIPPAIGFLTNLECLDIGSNDIEELPEELFNLTKLTNLYLDDNKITRLSDKITQLTNLGTLWLPKDLSIDIDLSFIPTLKFMS